MRDGDTDVANIAGTSVSVYDPFTSIVGTPIYQVGEAFTELPKFVKTSASINGQTIELPNKAVLESTLYQNGNQFAQITNIGNVAFNSWVDAKNGFYVNGTKVIGGQGNAIPNAASDTNSLQTTINAILGVLRAHGLIAT